MRGSAGGEGARALRGEAVATHTCLDTLPPLTLACERGRPAIDDFRPIDSPTFISSTLARTPSSEVHHGMSDTTMRESATVEMLARVPVVAAHRQNDVDWLIDNLESYGRLLGSLHRAERSVRIAQLAFDGDCAVYAGGSLSGSAMDEEVLADTLIALARDRGVRIQILLNATWILNTARPLRKLFAARGMSPEQIEVRGLSRFPHFMHAKLVLIDEREAFLLGSPFVNSYWDDGSHIPLDARRPLRDLGGRPLHDVSAQLRGPVVRDLESMFGCLWRSSGGEQPSAVPVASHDARVSAVRMVCDAPDGILPNVPDRAMQMLGELIAAIARVRSFIYIEHQYPTSRPIVAALAAALRREPALEIIIVLNQNPDLTAYRGWQNAQLRKHALLAHARVGVFTLWSTGAHPECAGAPE